MHFNKFKTHVQLKALKHRNICNRNCFRIIDERLFTAMVWNKIYRKEVVANLQFLVNKINADEYWTYKVFVNSKKIVKIPKALYFYRRQAASIMRKKYSLKRLDGFLIENQNVVALAEKNITFGIK